MFLLCLNLKLLTVPLRWFHIKNISIKYKFKLKVSDKFLIKDPSTMDYRNFKGTIIDSLNNHPHLKRKYLRANHLKFITKKLNLFLKVRPDENRIRYKKQRNNVSHYFEKLKGSTAKILV